MTPKLETGRRLPVFRQVVVVTQWFLMEVASTFWEATRQDPFYPLSTRSTHLRGMPNGSSCRQ